jgi:hypothetical protein
MTTGALSDLLFFVGALKDAAASSFAGGVHEPAAFEDAFRLPARHLKAALASVQYFGSRFAGRREHFAVVGSGPSGLKRAQ